LKEKILNENVLNKENWWENLTRMSCPEQCRLIWRAMEVI
jgi:hypothetical protein